MVYLWKPPFDLPQYLLGSVAIKKHTKFISGNFVSKLIHTMISEIKELSFEKNSEY